MPNFEEVLSLKASEIEKPKPKPTGTFLCQIMGLPKQRTITPKDGGEPYPVLDFNCKRLMAQPDVDPDEMSEATDKSPIHDWAPLQHSVFLSTEQNIWGYRQWLINVLGIEPGEGKSAKTLGEMTSEAVGKQLLCKVKLDTYVNREGQAEMNNKIESTAHV